MILEKQWSRSKEEWSCWLLRITKSITRAMLWGSNAHHFTKPKLHHLIILIFETSMHACVSIKKCKEIGLLVVSTRCYFTIDEVVSY